MTNVGRALTAAEAKKRITRRGQTIKEWAKSNGLDPRTVSEVLCGVNKGVRGKGHKVAVALGMKVEG